MDNSLRRHNCTFADAVGRLAWPISSVWRVSRHGERYTLLQRFIYIHLWRKQVCSLMCPPHFALSVDLAISQSR